MAALDGETGCEWALTDLRDEPAVAPMAAQVSLAGRVDALVNVAGGALGVESVAKGAPDTWMEMEARMALKTEWMRSNARVSCGDECCNETVIFQGIDIVLVVEQD